MKIFFSRISVFTRLTLVSFLFLSFTQVIVWLDKNHDQVSEENGIFYRPIPNKKRSVCLIVDYYKSGAKYREGKASSLVIKKENFKGLVNYFYEDGSVLKTEKYKNGILDGPYKE